MVFGVSGLRTFAPALDESPNDTDNFYCIKNNCE